MIDRILERLEEKKKKNISSTIDYEHGLYMGYKGAIEIVQDVAKDGGWIPCKVEMPPMPKENPVFDNKPLELYLVTLATTEYPFRAFWTGKEFTDGWGKLSYVTAWQPLPPKYEP